MQKITDLETSIENSNQGKGKNSVSGVLKTFSEDTSIHGWKHSFDHRKSWWQRGIWIILGTVAVGSLFRTLFVLHSAFSKYPFQTVFNIRPMEKLPFPAVTICNINGIEKSKLQYQDSVTQNLSSVFAELHFLATVQKQNTNLSLVENLKDFVPVEVWNLVYQDVVRPTFANLNDTLVYCFWEGQQESCRSMFQPLDLATRRCFQFNSQLREERRVSRLNGLSSGLQVLVNVHQEEYLYSFSMAAGAQIFLHEPGEMPDIEQDGFLAGPGYSINNRITLAKYVYLPAPYKAFGNMTCKEKTDFPPPLNTIAREWNIPYSYTQCRRICLTNITQKRCGCRPTNYLFPNEPQLPLCTMGDMYGCFFRTYVNVSKWTPESDCLCPRSCHRSEYRTSTSNAYFPSDVTREIMDNPDENNVRKNFFELKVFYDQLVVYEMTHVPVYTIESILGTIGGQMGLFIGASLLSVMEVFHLLCVLISRGARALYQRLNGEKDRT